jgi:hypothetical protein
MLKGGSGRVGHGEVGRWAVCFGPTLKNNEIFYLFKKDSNGFELIGPKVDFPYSKNFK